MHKMSIPQIYTGDNRPPISPHVIAFSTMGIKLGVSGFLPTTQAKTNAIQMRPQSLGTVWCFMRVYLHAKTAVDASDIRT